MVFITEGQSASGSIVSSRDPMTQAVFSLKGKPMNVFGQELTLLYKNEEMYSLMRALNIEESVGGLRFDKVILATDADVDGLHISNLLLTFFLHYFEPLVKRGHVYILETPIFRVRTKTGDRLLLFREGKDSRREEAGRPGRQRLKVEITRFKGLGEISPKEFKQFIGPDIRLQQVTIDQFERGAQGARILHGQEHPGTQGVHHGSPGNDEPVSGNESSKNASTAIPL